MYALNVSTSDKGQYSFHHGSLIVILYGSYINISIYPSLKLEQPISFCSLEIKTDIIVIVCLLYVTRDAFYVTYKL